MILIFFGVTIINEAISPLSDSIADPTPHRAWGVSFLKSHIAISKRQPPLLIHATISEKHGQYLIIHHFSVEPLPQNPHLFEILLTKGKQVNTIGIFVDQLQARLAEFIEPAGFQFPEKYAFLNAVQAEFLALFGYLVADSVFGDIVNDPNQYGHADLPSDQNSRISSQSGLRTFSSASRIFAKRWASC